MVLYLLKKPGYVHQHTINPSIVKDGLALNIDTNNNVLDFELVNSVGTYFRLDEKHLDTVIKEVKQATSKRKTIAKELGIPRSEIKLMTKAFINT